MTMNDDSDVAAVRLALQRLADVSSELNLLSPTFLAALDRIEARLAAAEAYALAPRSTHRHIDLTTVLNAYRATAVEGEKAG